MKILKLKFIHWHKKVQLLKFNQAACLIKRKYHIYKRKKSKK